MVLTLSSPTSVCPLQSRLEALWGLVGELDRHLQEGDGKMPVDLSGHPKAEAVVDKVSLCHGVH